MLFKRLSRRTLFSLTPSSLPSPYSFIAQCSTSSPSHLTYLHSQSHPDLRNVSVSVIWDIDSCPAPLGVNAYRVPQAIQTVFKSNGIEGPIQITVFGDVPNSRTNPWVVRASGAFLAQVRKVENVSVWLSRAVESWRKKYPLPANVLVITADTKSESFLGHLISNNYNIFLATNKYAFEDLRRNANIIWCWDALARGDMNCCKGDSIAPVFHSKTVPPVLSQNSFWSDLRTFINSDRGLYIILESTNREDMANYLKNYGPSDLRSVTVTLGDALYVVDLLISDKKWLLETPFLGKPFQLNPNPPNPVWLQIHPKNYLTFSQLVWFFMLAGGGGLLIYRKQFTGEQKTLDMVFKQAPRELLQLIKGYNVRG